MSSVNDPEQLLFGYIAGRYGPPAFVRRQQQVEAAWQAILHECRTEYERLLTPIRWQIAVVAAMLEIPASDEFDAKCALLRINLEVERRWRRPHEMPRRARIEFERLVASARQFDQHWTAFVKAVDLAEVNRLREGYNRYFVLEKECALRSERLAQLGFQPLSPATHTALFAQFSTLLVRRAS